MKTFAHYLKSSKRGTGFLHGISGQGITMWISVWSTRPISVFLGASMTCRDILLLQFCLLDLVALVFCFTKLLRPLVKRWRSMSHGSFVYLGMCLVVNRISVPPLFKGESLTLWVFSSMRINPIGIPCKLANGWVS